LNRYINYIYAASASLLTFIVYVLTLYPSIGFIDSGELAAVCYTFGIPHPTGYPLYLIAGYLFTHLPLPWTVIYKSNLLSAVLSSAAVFVTYFNILNILKNTLQPLNTTGKSKTISIESGKITVSVSAFFGALLTGFIQSFWYNATQTEVYSLHFLFISVIYYYLLAVLFTSGKSNNYLYWALLFLFLGFSFANHSTTVYFIPVLLYLFYLLYKSQKRRSFSIAKYTFLVLPGISLYGLLLLRAKSEPYFNWSNPYNLTNLLNHLRGEEFSHLMFSSGSVFVNNMKNFFVQLPSEFGIVPLIFSFAGLYYTWRFNRKLFTVFIILILTNLIISFNYNTIEIKSFYLSVYYTLAINSSAGIVYLCSLVKLLNYSLKIKIISCGTILALISVAYNYSTNDNSSDYSNHDYTVNVLNYLRPGSVLLTMEYSYLYSGSMYFQLVEGLRQDVKVIMLKFLSAPWYLRTLEKFHNELYEPVRKEAEEYIKAYNSKDPNMSAMLNSLVEKFIDNISKNYPLYFTVDFVLNKDVQNIVKKYNTVPDGMVYRYISSGSGYIADSGLGSLDDHFRRFKPDYHHRQKLYNIIPGMYYENAYYHYRNNNRELALRFLDKSLEFNPDFDDAVKLKNRILSEKKDEP